MSGPDRISGVIFDMDGTLIDSLMLWDILWEALSLRYCDGKPFLPSPQVDLAIRTVPLDRAMELLYEAHPMGPDPKSLLRTAREIFLDFYNTRVQLMPGAMDFIRACRSRGVPMYVATASDPELVHAALTHCGIQGCIGGLVTCAQVGHDKHSPHVYERALELLGTPKAETWVFEDSYAALLTAHRAGFPTVGVYNKYSAGQDTLRSTARVYVGPGEAMTKCLDYLR